MEEAATEAADAVMMGLFGVNLALRAALDTPEPADTEDCDCRLHAPGRFEDAEPLGATPTQRLDTRDRPEHRG
jgi:hypothetical protein